LVNNVGGSCPAVYGDPALLAPLVYNPDVEIKHEVGVVLRWSEKSWLKVKPGKGVKLIDLGTSDVEGVIDQIKSCKKIITSSLHGLIIADTYGIPNAWLSSSTPKGGEFKFYDYFLSVDKIRHANSYDIDKKGLGLNTLLSEFDFDDRYINFAPNKLLDACPFLKRK
jgi:pyruvyltransferase